MMDDQQQSISGARLVVMAGGAAQSFPLTDETAVLVGREETCLLRIDHTAVSREHLRIRVEGGAVTVEELGSRNGTKLHGRRLEKAQRTPLNDGDSLELGEVVITLKGSVLPSAAKGPVPFPPGSPDGAFTKALIRIRDVAPTRAFVLLSGEPSVGKTALAFRLHETSGVKGPFVRVTSVDVVPAELEEELFGVEGEAEAGAFQTAVGGTLLLDDIGEMPLATQEKVVAAIQKSGGTTNLRFLAATHRNLEDLVAKGSFRADLHALMKDHVIAIPPIRERKDELNALADVFLAATCARLGRTVPTLSGEAQTLLRDHKWPGNLRELRIAMERVVPLVRGNEVMGELLGLDPTQRTFGTPHVPAAGSSASLRTELDAFEKARVIAALDQANGSQARAAELLGLPLRTFVKRLTRFGLTKPRKKPMPPG
jgi:two-component system, NtrC family, response regulator AtoC